MSFLSESRRLDNTRLKRELRRRPALPDRRGRARALPRRGRASDNRRDAAYARGDIEWNACRHAARRPTRSTSSKRRPARGRGGGVVAADRSRSAQGARLARQADPPRLAVQPRRRDRRAQSRHRRETVAAPRPAGDRRRGAGRQHDQGRRRRRQGRPRRLHLHDHDDVDAREQHRALHQAAVRSGQGLHADHAGVARQRPADGAGQARLTATCKGFIAWAKAQNAPDHLRLVGRRLVGATCTARSSPRTTASA